MVNVNLDNLVGSILYYLNKNGKNKELLFSKVISIEQLIQMDTLLKNKKYKLELNIIDFKEKNEDFYLEVVPENINLSKIILREGKDSSDLKKYVQELDPDIISILSSDEVWDVLTIETTPKTNIRIRR